MLQASNIVARSGERSATRLWSSKFLEIQELERLLITSVGVIYCNIITNYIYDINEDKN